MLGLMKIKDFGTSQVLWIKPCNSVHTFRMKFNLDLIYLDKTNHVTKVVKNIVPARFSMCWQAYSVLETHSGFANRFTVVPGDIVICIDS